MLTIEGACLLPGGLILEDGTRLGWAELRPLSGHEEEWLAQHPGVPPAIAVTHLLGACLVTLDGHPADRELARRLLVGDRDYLMLELRRITLGDLIRAVLVCPACNSKMDIDFRIANVPVERRPQASTSYTLALGGASGPERTVCFRLPTGGDQEAMLSLAPDEAADALLVRCLLDDGGAALTPEEQETVAAEMERLAPQVELELELTCPECSHAFVTLFDTTAFFLAEMRTQAGQLLREIHHLAFHYHWAEGEILGLTRSRRHTYLSLLNEMLQASG